MPVAISTARLEARISTDLHSMLKRAAELQGCTMTDFVVAALQAAAQRAIGQAEVIRLSLADALDRAARPEANGERQKRSGSGFLPASRLHCLARLAAHAVLAAGNRPAFLKLAIPGCLNRERFSGTSPATSTPGRATCSARLLADHNYAGTVKIGTTNTYVVNEQLAFAGSAGQRTAVFSATVAAHEGEQEEGWDQVKKLKAVPVIYDDERVILGADELSPPDQQDLNLN